jgi:Rod binding domain-containing protein
MSDPIISARPVLPPPSVQRQPAQPARQDQTAKLARDFEGVFAGQMVKIMMESAEVKNEFSGGAGESMFRGILAEQIGNQIAHSQGLGIASAVEAQIIRMQEGK